MAQLKSTIVNGVLSVTDTISEGGTLLSSKYVPQTRTVNGKALSSNISLSASDVSAVASNTAITAATKCKITYDSKGLVTSGANLAASDIPALNYAGLASGASSGGKAASAASADAVAWSGVSGKPNTISGYGITDAKISNGVITLGSTSITPITDVSGKADKATTLAGYGITDAKIVNGVITLGSTTITPITDVSGKTDKTTLTTKGDMYYASSASTPARLAVGSNGQFLSVSSGVPTWVNNPNTDTKDTASTDDFLDNVGDDEAMYLVGTAYCDEGVRKTYSMPGVFARDGYLYSDGGRVWTRDDTISYATSAGSASTAASATYASSVYGSYSGDGGKQGPSYFGTNRAGFLMSNQNVNDYTNYTNWLYMDNYSGNDVGGATAIGVARTYPRAFIMQSDANRSSWNNISELVTTQVSNGGDALSCLQNAFNSTPKSTGVAMRLQHGSHSMAFGWFLNGYSYSQAYGGWFVSAYGTPMWVGVDAGTWRYNYIITSAGGTVSGSLTATGFYVSSSKKIKKDIEIFNKKAIDILDDVKVVSFKFDQEDADDFTHIGFIAEDTSDILSTPSHDKMDTNSCIGVLIKAVQELKAEVEELKKQLKKQEV